MSCTNDQSSVAASPKSYSHTSRSKTPEPTATSLVNPSSSLLQDLLKEQRASRGSRGNVVKSLDDCTPQTPTRSRSHSHSQSQSQEEMGSERQRKINSALSAGLKQPREMGIREMDHYVSKINKQNFDLKLEIFHRAQQMIVLEKKLVQMHKMEEELRRMRQLEDELQELRNTEEDNQRLRESNEQLRHEIDKRDQAVTEAVDLICRLEARVEELEAGEEDLSRPSTARPPSDGPDLATPKNRSTVNFPERTSPKQGPTSSEYHRTSSESRHLIRAPSFLRDEKESTAALRSLYVPVDDQSRSVESVMTKSESLQSVNEASEVESPRLSALSECSELNPFTDGGDRFDQIEIPIRQKELAPENASLLSTREDDEGVRINCWIQPLPEPPLGEVPRRKPPPVSVVRESNNKPSFDSDSCFNSSSQRTPLDSVFGSTRLPPTPDTMSTAYAGGTKGTSVSTAAGQSQTDPVQTVKLGLIRPRSAGELTSRQASSNSRLRSSMDSNLSEVTLPRPSFDEKDNTPVLFPLDSLTSRTGALHSQESVVKPTFKYYGGNGMCNPDGLEKVFSKLDRNHYSRARHSKTRADSPDTPSSPQLTPQDWIEAAKPGNLARKDATRAHHPTDPMPAGSRPVGARAASQSSFLGRRHSIDSAVRDADDPMVPTLDLRSFGPSDQREPDAERSRRRISLRPPFFGRSGTSRRLQPSPTFEEVDKDDGAPSPVVRKTRQIANARVMKANTPVEDSLPAPTYADPEETVPRNVPHSATEFTFHSRHTGSHGKDHKRRSSLGLFGWVKGGGLGLSGRKSELTDSGHSGGNRASRFGYDGSIPEASVNLAGMDVVVEDFAYAPKGQRLNQEEGRRRRRSRR
ncbi:uncharacterized protein ATNIH1004_004568 [Aspergillus tanneri]|nr:uncharacterized protein ATNIH1004_004568 [Aspergillus tanneri]KAA8648683.1 hypothetical protein ATNIH1004_004568 [Aspergillus tanneri]